MYKISRSVCNEQQLEHKMHVMDIRTACICEEISYVPIWEECIKIKICLHKCIFVKRNVNKIKYIVTTTDTHAKTDYTSYFPDNAFNIECNYA